MDAMAKSCGTTSDSTISSNRAEIATRHENPVYRTRYVQFSNGHHRDIPPHIAHYSFATAHCLLLLPRFKTHVCMAHASPHIRQTHQELPGESHHTTEGKSLYTPTALGLTPFLRLYPLPHLAQMLDDRHRHWRYVAYTLL